MLFGYQHEQQAYMHHLKGLSSLRTSFPSLSTMGILKELDEIESGQDKICQSRALLLILPSIGAAGSHAKCRLLRGHQSNLVIISLQVFQSVLVFVFPTSKHCKLKMILILGSMNYELINSRSNHFCHLWWTPTFVSGASGLRISRPETA